MEEGAAANRRLDIMGVQTDWGGGLSSCPVGIWVPVGRPDDVPLPAGISLIGAASP